MHMLMIEFKRPFLLGPAFFFLPSSRTLVDYYLERGGMPSHDAVWVNSKKDANTENQGAGAGYVG